MELLEGRDVAHWLAERERSWKEVVALFIEAGKGLAAAHEIGIIHRDPREGARTHAPARRV